MVEALSVTMLINYGF